ncbi:hypothetical protein Z949_635 [Sulfitobacter guttiformis KCTC 32187]|nr:hypothetical protein Z949_635 [Sulfitobacter guttiformis KCTC 32187]
MENRGHASDGLHFAALRRRCQELKLIRAKLNEIRVGCHYMHIPVEI